MPSAAFFRTSHDAFAQGRGRPRLELAAQSSESPGLWNSLSEPVVFFTFRRFFVGNVLLSCVCARCGLAVHASFSSPGKRLSYISHHAETN